MGTIQRDWTKRDYLGLLFSCEGADYVDIL